LPRSIAESQGAVSLGYRQITIESLEILKTIERSGEQRVEAAAWPFLLSLPAGASDGDRANDVPWTRCRSALVVAIVAAIQEGQFGFNFSSCLLRDSKSSYICNSGRALRRRRARPANNSFTKFEFNQAWLAES
jgi:hypothetical protein